MTTTSTTTTEPTTSWPTHPWVTVGAGQVRFGIAYGPRADWAACHELVRTAEELGFDSYWAMDHPTSGFDCWSTLTALAVTTRRIRLGSLVSCVYYRSPAQLARLAADVDRLSGGRLILGIGIGNHEKEFAKLGISFPPISERLEALEETLQIVRGLWGEAPFSFAGQRFRMDRATAPPGPVQKPRVPILIAGGGERVTLRQVAQYADVSNFSPHHRAGRAFSVDDVRRKLAALDQYGAAFGRPPESLLRSQVAVPVVLAETPAALQAKLDAIPAHIRESYYSSTLAGLPCDAVAYYRRLSDAGLSYFIAGIYGNDVETVRLLAHQVMPELAP